MKRKNTRQFHSHQLTTIHCGLLSHAILNFQGYKLNVYDVSAEASEAMEAKGAKVFSNTQELAKASEFVLTMLPNNDIVTQTYEQMIKDGVNSKTLFVDSSTVDPNVSQYVQKIVSKAGASFVDAPVSGGVMGAQNATLTFMVGGTKEEFERVKGFLEGNKTLKPYNFLQNFFLNLFERHGKENYTLWSLWNGRSSQNLQQHDVGYKHDWNSVS